MALTATNYPSTSTLGAVVESLVQQDPGIDLAAMGMAGCRRFLNPDVSVIVGLAAGTTVYNQAIPNTNSLVSMRLFAQFEVFAPGANATGVIVSN